VRNSEIRYLFGYKKKLTPDFTAGAQIYTEVMQDYSAYMDNLPSHIVPKDESRNIYTISLTQNLMEDKVILSLFGYYSPTDVDGYARPKITYKANEDLTFELGGNIFFGEKQTLSNGTKEHTTFFGQFEDNTNAFISMRYSF